MSDQNSEDNQNTDKVAIPHATMVKFKIGIKLKNQQEKESQAHV